MKGAAMALEAAVDEKDDCARLVKDAEPHARRWLAAQSRLTDHEAEDLTQEALCSLLYACRKNGFAADSAAAIGVVYAKRRAFDHWRKQRSQRRSLQPGEELPSAESRRKEERRIMLLECIQRCLTHDEGKVVKARFWARVAWSEIRETLGIPQRTAQKLFTSAKKKMQRCLADD